MKAISVTSGGVYRIKCKANGRFYIGSTASFVLRFALHVNELNGRKHHNHGLLEDWIRHGIDEFTFTPLAILNDKRERKRMEIQLINKANGNRMYNVAGNIFMLPKGSKRLPRRVRKLSTSKSAAEIGVRA